MLRTKADTWHYFGLPTLTKTDQNSFAKQKIPTIQTAATNSNGLPMHVQRNWVVSLANSNINCFLILISHKLNAKQGTLHLKQFPTLLEKRIRKRRRLNRCLGNFLSSIGMSIQLFDLQTTEMSVVTISQSINRICTWNHERLVPTDCPKPQNLPTLTGLHVVPSTRHCVLQSPL